jgi:hypothetical protein
MTTEDMIEAISVIYGTAALPLDETAVVSSLPGKYERLRAMARLAVFLQSSSSFILPTSRCST